MERQGIQADASAPRIGLVGTPELVTFPRFDESLRACGAAVVPIDPMDLVAFVSGVTSGFYLPDFDVSKLDGFFAPVAGAASVVMMGALRHLEAVGLPTINRVMARVLARDKFATGEALASAGIPHPRTFLVGGSQLAMRARRRAARELGFPLVVKGRLGTLGSEVHLARSEQDLERVVGEMAVHIDDGILLQEFFDEAKGHDLRVVVLDGSIVAVKARWSGREDEFRSAMPGYVATIGEISEEESAMAIAATVAVGLDYSGIDLMRTRHGPRVLEVNANPFLATTERVTGVDIAGAVAGALMERVNLARPIHCAGS